MKKADFVVESAGTDGDAYRLHLPRLHKEVRMSFNDWLHFLATTFHKFHDTAFDFAFFHCFTGLDGYLMLYQSITAVIETSDPHALHIYAPNMNQSWILALLEKYQPQYGDKSIRLVCPPCPRF